MTPILGCLPAIGAWGWGRSSLVTGVHSKSLAFGIFKLRRRNCRGGNREFRRTSACHREFVVTIGYGVCLRVSCTFTQTLFLAIQTACAKFSGVSIAVVTVETFLQLCQSRQRHFGFSAFAAQ